MDVRVGLWRKLIAKELMLLEWVLEKTLESPLDCKEIQPIHSKGDQPWVFFGSEVKLAVMSDSLWPHGLQHTRPPCPSPTSRVYPNSRPLSWLCHPAISSSVVPFSSCLQSFPASGSYQISQLFTSGGQSIGVSALASVFPMNIQDLFISFRIDCFHLLAVQDTLKSLLQYQSLKASVPLHSAFFIVHLLYLYLTTGKTIALTRWTFVGK